MDRLNRIPCFGQRSPLCHFSVCRLPCVVVYPTSHGIEYRTMDKDLTADTGFETDSCYAATIKRVSNGVAYIWIISRLAFY
jgi:hypothetical protein